MTASKPVPALAAGDRRAALGSERHAPAYLLGTLIDRVTDYTAQSGGGQRDSQRGEEPEASG